MVENNCDTTLDKTCLNYSETIESQYFGSINYFKKIGNASCIKINAFERFQKSTFRTRCIISGSNGLINLTVPLLGGRDQKALMRDVRIDNSTNWRKIHCRSIQSSYAKSPFYAYYAEQVFAIVNKPHVFLLELNMELLIWLLERLQFKTTVELSTEIEQAAHTSREKVSTSQPAPDGWQPVYFQVFQNKFGFQPNLCILDLLFAEGPNAGHLIMSSV